MAWEKGGTMGKVYNVYFSGKGTTKAVAEALAREIGRETITCSLRENPILKNMVIPKGDMLLVSMPVYGGLIPRICVPMLEKLTGNGNAAVIAAVYGNRDYDDALIQMKDLLQARGFRVIGAGAFLAEHSIFPKVAADRPSEKDFTGVRIFAGRCRDIAADEGLYRGRELQVKGDPHYKTERKFGGVPFHPDGDRTCMACGTCAKVCPVHAISVDNFRETDTSLCISCGACIAACPAKARDYHGVAYKTASLAFQAKCAFHKEPEVFYI